MTCCKLAFVMLLFLVSPVFGTVIFDGLPVFAMPYSPYNQERVVSNMTPYVLHGQDGVLRVVGWSFSPGDIFFQDKLFLKLTDNTTGKSIYIEHDKWHVGWRQVFDYSDGDFEFVRGHSYTWSYFVAPEPSCLFMMSVLFFNCGVRK